MQNVHCVNINDNNRYIVFCVVVQNISLLHTHVRSAMCSEYLCYFSDIRAWSAFSAPVINIRMHVLAHASSSYNNSS